MEEEMKEEHNLRTRQICQKQIISSIFCWIAPPYVLVFMSTTCDDNREDWVIDGGTHRLLLLLFAPREIEQRKASQIMRPLEKSSSR